MDHPRLSQNEEVAALADELANLLPDKNVRYQGVGGYFAYLSLLSIWGREFERQQAPLYAIHGDFIDRIEAFAALKADILRREYARRVEARLKGEDRGDTF